MSSPSCRPSLLHRAAAAKPVTSLIDDMSAKLSSSSWTPTSFIQECTSQVSLAVDFGMKKADKVLDSVWMNDVLPLQELVAVSSVFCIAYGLFGGVPILSQVVNFMLGPGLLALGSGTIVLGVDDCQNPSQSSVSAVIRANARRRMESIPRFAIQSMQVY